MSSKGKGKADDGAPSNNADLDLLPWVEKYRPATLDDLVSHKDITSTILAMARKIYGPQFRNSVLELNASDDRGIEVVREQIKSFGWWR